MHCTAPYAWYFTILDGTGAKKHWNDDFIIDKNKPFSIRDIF